jgi:transposase-like protein
MSVDEIENTLNDLEARKGYDRAKKGSNELKAEVEVTKQDSKLEQDKIVKLEEENRILKSGPAEVKLDCKELEAQLEVKDGELSKLKSRISELENLHSVTNGRTLAEAEKIIFEEKQEEIGRQAREYAKILHFEWEQTSKPREVAEGVLIWLNMIINGLLMPEHKFFPKETIEIGLPKKVEEAIELEVNRKIDDEFKRRIAMEVNNQLSVEWPRRHEQDVLELNSLFQRNIFEQLKGPWTIRCDKCNMSLMLRLPVKGVEDLIRAGFVYANCINSNCIGKTSLEPYIFKVTIADLITSKTTSFDKRTG